MEENMENKDGLRVTRARTRRLSVLDTDSRSSTPQLDLGSDRGTASPRPLRRTRLNSATIDLRTPTRATRSSVARGETPEPITPSASAASLRSARTPAKSARKQLPLQEEDEEPIQIKLEPKSSPLELGSGVSPPSGEKRVTRSMSKTPPIAAVKPQQSQRTPSGEKRVIRSMSKTPPIAAVKPQQSQRTPKEDSSQEKAEHHVSKSESNVSPAPINTQSKTTEIEKTERTSKRGTPKLTVKIKEISETILTNCKTTYKETPQSGEEHVLTVAAPMEVDESVPCSDDVQASSPAKLEETVKAVNLEKSLTESTSADKSETKSQTEITEAPTELIKTNSAQEERENVMEASMKINSPNKKKNVSIYEISDTEQEEISNKETEEIKDLSKELSKEIVCEKEEETEAVVIESDSSFQSVEVASPKSEGKAPTDVEKDMDADKSFESMETASPKDKKEEEKIELEETNNNDVRDDGASVANSSIDVISNLRLPDLSPDLKERIVSKSDQKDELKKSVVFNSDQDQEVDDKSYNKRKFPKTPSRDKPPLSSANIKSFMMKERDTPLKTVVVKVRHSSTPIQKAEEISLTKSVANSSSTQPPAQIDSIKPLVMPVEMEGKPASPKVVPRRLVSDNEDEDQEDVSEDEENICLFVDNEVEVADDNYQSGDSMDSSERREIEENEVPCDGESVGSQDTESFGENESGENDSFIVSDNDVEEDEVEEEEDIEPLCWDNDQEEDAANSSKDSKKQRRRIIVVASSDEDEDGVEPEVIELEQMNRSNTSNASKLSEAAMMLNGSIDDGQDDEMDVDPELESSRKMILHDISKPDCLNKTASRLEISTVDINTTVEGSSDTEPDPKEKPGEIKPSTSTAKADDEALLAELASGDLTHLQKMFNPLQKSRRQSLYLPSSEMMVTKEPKLKRRSERMLNDFNPSQSFMEMVAEHQRQQPKRQRLSKSFCGAADDEILEQTEQVQIVLESKKMSEPELAKDEPNKTVNREEEIATISSAKDKTKSVDHYMKYCDEILHAANQAKLEQKKQEIAAQGNDAKKRKKSLRKTKPPAVNISVSPEPDANPADISGVAKKLKKKVKRLVPDKKKAIQNAVNRAIELLVPEMVRKEPQSLVRKLSPQPTVANPNPKAKNKANKQLEKQKRQLQQQQKQKQQLVSPIKSSDEENHHHQRPIERIKTNAGYVTVYKDDSPQRSVIELIKTNSGIFRVEPSTPTLKYFEELPATPKVRKPGFREEPVDPKKRLKRKPTGESGSATESAKRFKARIFTRKL